MTYRTRAIVGRSARGAGMLLAALATGLALPGASALAKEMKLPAGKPAVAFEVPGDWAIEATATGLEMRSPEKNAIVVAKVIEKQKPVVEAFAKSAAAALQAFGVSFAKDAKVPAKPAPAAKPQAEKAPATAPAAKSGAKASPENLSAFDPKAEAFTFTGSPSLAMPGTAASNDPQKNVPNSLEDLTGFGAPAPNATKLPLRAAQYFGTSLGGKPVDVQLVLFSLPDNRYLAMMQESGADDGRTVAMAQSVKTAK